MLLKELEIQGFKSFPDRIKVPIDKGITAVVGPNGSGKSNISDAIRWVLGEPSSRQLRGAGKMEDVIFGGTQTRGAMGYASVNLTVDNTDRRIDVNADEVVIGRKYYRSGESEYTINGKSVRLKDIYELFLDTGLGRDGYSIIGQGRIAEIVGAKSSERREIFEEASGIARYRYRKNEAERRLASAEDNLERLRDILDELAARVEPLERESKKAQQFLELSARRKELEVTLWVDSVKNARETVRQQQRLFETAQADYNRLTQELEQLEEQTQEIHNQMNRLTMEVEDHNGEIRSITQEMSTSESRIAVLENNIQHNQQSIQQLNEEIAQSEAGREGYTAQMEEHRSRCQAIEQTMEQLAEEITQLEQELDRLTQENAQAGQRRGQVSGQLAQASSTQTEAKVRAAGCESAAQTTLQRLESLDQQHAAQEQVLDQLRQEEQETALYLKKVEQTVTRLENIRQGLQLKLDSRTTQLQQAQDSLQQVTRQREANAQRLQLLKDLERNMNGYQHSVKTVIRAAEHHRLRGIIGPVSSILTVKPGYEVAIEIALGFALQNIVVEGESAAKAAMAFLREERAGRATFLPLDTVKGTHFDASRLSGSARVASSLVEYDPKYDRIVANLLGRIIVVDEINEASQVARQLDYRNRIVTTDGQVINAGGSFTGGSVSQSAGLFTRRQEIEELEKKAAQLEQRQAKASQALQKAQQEVEQLAAQLEQAAAEAVTAGGDRIRAQTELSRIRTALETACQAGRERMEQRAQLEDEIQQQRSEMARAQAQVQRLTGVIAALEEELRQLAGSDDAFLQNRSALSEQLSQKRLERPAAEKDIGLHQAAIRELESRHGESHARHQSLRRTVDELTEQNQQHQQAIADIHAQRKQDAQRIQELEQAIRQAVQLRMEKEASISKQSQAQRQITDQREKMSQEMARLNERKSTAEKEYDEVIAKLWEEYQLTMSEAQELCVPFENLNELRRQVAETRSRIRSLGNVNVGAIEEYQEVSGRYTFLKEQVADVEKSKAELSRLISELSNEMRTIFSESFAQINRHFARIFHELFGGGTASLRLENEEDVLESGIEIQVSPPGKVIRNLAALSGGEQALVAISIYFAILAVNPAPFCILDEIEAALDDVNVARYAQYLRRITAFTQFIVITHRRGTMEAADVLYGVTMQEDGVSKLLRLDLEQVDATLVS